jgi:putative flavoprotein involved in K+ transport
MAAEQAERFETVIVGGGQAGLSTGYHLARRGRTFVILDARERIGDSWRTRWDSLRVFTPARYSGLPGWDFPASPLTYPTKDAIAEYLEAYAARFELPVRSGVEVDSLSREGDRYLVTAGDQRFEADNVVIASGSYHGLRVPDFASELAPEILQLGSTDYRRPSQLREGGVLVVGAGNSGAEIALDVARTHETWLSGKHPGSEPTRAGSIPDRLLMPLFWFLISDMLTVKTRIGRAFRRKFLSMAAPLGRVRPRDLKAAGVVRVARTVGVHDGAPALEDGRVLDVANVIWCTGFRADFAWVDLPGFGEDGEPVHERGVVAGEPGLYLVGRPFQFGFTSSLLGGVGRDAEHVVERIVAAADGRRAVGRMRPARTLAGEASRP